VSARIPESALADTPRLTVAQASALTFLASGTILVLEIAAARLMAPYVGVSLTTYTSIIGIILAGIALGAWLGGRLADLTSPERLLGPTFVLGGITAIASVPIVAVLGPALGGVGPQASLVLSMVAFVVPAAVLAAVAPMIVRATIRDVETSGSLVGRLSAVGTVGALVGTFLTGYVLLGLVPVRTLIVATGVLLVLIGIGLVLRFRGGATAGVVALVVLGGGLAVASAVMANPCERESAYYCIAVREDEDRPAGRTLILDDLRHAHVTLDDPTALEFAYVRWFAAGTEDIVAADADLAALHLGGGGFSFPRYLLAVAPDSRHDVLELDPVVLATAREELGFAPDDRIDVALGDARLTIPAIADDSRAIVVGDAFGGRSVPWHLATVEFAREIDRVLAPGGRYVQNLIDGPSLRFVRAETATLRQVFEHVAVITWSAAFDGRSGGNAVVVASHEPIDVESLRARVQAATPGAAVLADPTALDAFTAGAPVLTDDFAPADQLIGG
jgi:spermidine synthase